jgi:hypothetical protein
MKTSSTPKPKNCCEDEATTRQRDCLPCDIPPFCRNNYYTGKLLTERDLTAEQRYLIDKLRLHHLALHGWGIICGLRVKPHPYCPDKKVILEPGMAIDGCGREIWVRHEVEICLPKPLQSPPVEEAPCPPEPTWPQPSEQGTPYHQGPPDAQQDPSETCPPVTCEPRESFYICVRYAECETEFGPAPFDECVCDGNPEKPSRICEGYKIVADSYWDVPDDWKRITESKEQCDEDCLNIYEHNATCCPKPGWPECIPVAVIPNYEAGETLTCDRIDNKTYRVLLPSTRTLDQLLRCILEKIPAKSLTCIEDVGWTHDHTYHCNEFMRCFVGEDNDRSRAFEVTFSGPVLTDGLNPYTFQAIVVRHPHDRTKAGSFMEVVPATVSTSTDTPGNLSRTKAYLHLDRGFVERCLRHVAFDLYITVRCNFIVDAEGNPVDGNFLARSRNGSTVVHPPTGDGIKGGTFESWIHVQP